MLARLPRLLLPLLLSKHPHFDRPGWRSPPSLQFPLCSLLPLLPRIPPLTLLLPCCSLRPVYLPVASLPPRPHSNHRHLCCFRHASTAAARTRAWQAGAVLACLHRSSARARAGCPAPHTYCRCAWQQASRLHLQAHTSATRLSADRGAVRGRGRAQPEAWREGGGRRHGRSQKGSRGDVLAWCGGNWAAQHASQIASIGGGGGGRLHDERGHGHKGKALGRGACRGRGQPHGRRGKTGGVHAAWGRLHPLIGRATGGRGSVCSSKTRGSWGPGATAQGESCTR